MQSKRKAAPFRIIPGSSIRAFSNCCLLLRTRTKFNSFGVISVFHFFLEKKSSVLVFDFLKCSHFISTYLFSKHHFSSPAEISIIEIYFLFVLVPTIKMCLSHYKLYFVALFQFIFLDCFSFLFSDGHFRILFTEIAM